MRCSSNTRKHFFSAKAEPKGLEKIIVQLERQAETNKKHSAVT